MRVFILLLFLFGKGVLLSHAFSHCHNENHQNEEHNDCEQCFLFVNHALDFAEWDFIEIPPLKNILPTEFIIELEITNPPRRISITENALRAPPVAA